MARREAIFCDLTTFDPKNLCNNVSTFICAVCSRDVCDHHSQNRGIHITIKLNVSKPGNPRPGVPNVARTELVSAEEIIRICQACADKLQNIDVVSGVGSEFKQVVEQNRTTAIDAVKAGFVTAALRRKGANNDP